MSRYRNRKPSVFELSDDDLQELTDSLIEKLLKKGFSLHVLIQARDMGLKYCEKRGSFVSDFVFERF